MSLQREARSAAESVQAVHPVAMQIAVVGLGQAAPVETRRPLHSTKHLYSAPAPPAL